MGGNKPKTHRSFSIASNGNPRVPDLRGWLDFKGVKFMKDEKILAYYSMHNSKLNRYVKVSRGHGTHLPCFGLSEGWIEATILEVYEGAKAKIRYHGPFRDSHYGMAADFDQIVDAWFLRKLDNPVNVSCSMLVIRWFDWWSQTGWSDYYIAKETPMKMLTEKLLEIEPEAETYTLFLRTSEDACKFQEELLGHVMKGRHRSAMYFLWPVQKFDASEKPAYCEERSFFDMMQRIEAVGVPTRYPAPAHLYRILCGKQMYTNMCLQKDYKVPITVRVQASEFINDEESVVDNTLRSINHLRERLYGRGPTDSGVVKLGFSWMGNDVLRYKGRDDLRSKLAEILSTQNQIPTTCMAQDLVENRIAELRIHAFCNSDDGFHYEIVYMLLKPASPTHYGEDFMMTGAKSIPPEQALHDLWNGNARAQEIAETEARRLVDVWLLWYKTEWTAPRCPANGRFDFHLCWDGTSDPELWTCEVTECGASLCGLNLETRSTAIVNSMFGDRKCDVEKCTCKNMAPLPSPRPAWFASWEDYKKWDTKEQSTGHGSPIRASPSPNQLHPSMLVLDSAKDAELGMTSNGSPASSNQTGSPGLINGSHHVDHGKEGDAAMTGMMSKCDKKDSGLKGHAGVNGIPVIDVIHNDDI